MRNGHPVCASHCRIKAPINDKARQWGETYKERGKEVPKVPCDYVVGVCFSTVQGKGKENQLDYNRHCCAASRLQPQSWPHLETPAKF